jgi:hypothetical protein
MATRNRSDAGSILAPAAHAVAVTPSDSANLPYTTTGLWVGGAGAISLVTAGGETVLLSGIPAGTILPIQATRIRATGTTATLIVALS